MKKIISLLYPFLQRLKFLPFILKFNSAKKSSLEESKILMFTTSRGVLGGNLLAIKNYIEKENLPFEVTAFTSVNMPEKAEVAKEMAKSKFIIVDDFEPLVYVLKLRKNQHLIQVWHAMGAFKKFGYSRESAVKNSLTHKNYTEAITSSKNLTSIYAEAFGIDEEKIKPVGVPRTDLLFDRTYIETTKVRLYAKEPHLLNKKICLFAPTFRGENVNDANYPNEFLDVEKLSNSLGNEWAIILKYHPFIKNKPNIPDSVKNNVFDFTDEREINDILFLTDVLVTDYSSVIFENAILDNASVLYAPDLVSYTKGRGFYFDYENYSCGEIVANKYELADAIKSAGDNKEKLKEFKERFVSSCDGNSTKRFVQEILLQR